MPSNEKTPAPAQGSSTTEDGAATTTATSLSSVHPPESTLADELNQVEPRLTTNLIPEAEPHARELTVETTGMTAVELHAAPDGMEATMDAAVFGGGDMQGSGSRSSISTSGSRSGAMAGNVRRLEPGTRVGRYLVVECIGAGAMGQVYAAFDPELDRKVALKIMNAGSAPGSSKDSSPSSPARRLMREAKALSQLAHPNVVSVFDVGSLGNEIFVAMEFVAGIDLRRWSKERARSWKEVLEVYLQAGQGLSAAHAAGLVHRDFKPHNAILGQDGRVRVLDFGLATPRSAAHHAKTANELLDTPLTRTGGTGGNTDAWERLTQTGSLLGTPAYMAPEVIAGQGADEKSDQFSFSVSLFQGLYDGLPFAGKTLREMADAIHSGRIAEPHGHHVPGWVRRALLRGLSADPAQRYPSMQEMLTALMRQDPSSVRTRWVMRMGAGVAAMVAVGLGVAGVVERNAQVCQGAEQRLTGVWDAARVKQVEAALLSTNVSYAADTWNRVKDVLDGYTRGWVSMHTDACQATHVKGEQSGELLDLRMVCLQERLGEVKALVDVLSNADAEILAKAVPAVNSLVPLSTCADVESLRSAVAPPRDPAVRQHVEALRERLEQARALERTGKYADGMAVVEALEKESRPLGYQPLTAELLLMKGILLSQRGKYPEATAVLEEANNLAADAKHVQVLALAVRELVFVVGFQMRRFDEGMVRAHYAMNHLRLAGLVDKLGDRLLSSMGLVMRRKGQFDKAIEYQARALDLCIKQMAPEQCHVYMRHLGTAHYSAGRFEEAETNLLKSIKDAQSVLGPNHPELAKSMNNYNLLLYDIGRYDEAMQWMQRALQIYEQAYGKNHVLVGDALNNIGNILWFKMEYAQALQHHQQALDIRLKALGPENSTVAGSHQNLGSDYLGLGKLELARQHTQKCIDLDTRLLGPDHPDTGACKAIMARVMLKEGKAEQAAALMDAAIASWKKSMGPDHPNLGELYLNQAEIAQARQDYSKARQVLEEALRIHEAKHIANRFTAGVHLELARTLWFIPGATSRTDARAHAEKAAALLARLGLSKSEMGRELDEWLNQYKP